MFPILNPPPSSSPTYHPSGSSQCTSPKHPVSCIEPGLATHFIYDIIRFNAIFPNHPTLSLSHRVQRIVLYINVSFAVSHTGLSEKAMAPHSRTLAWKIPWTEEPGRLQSMGLLRFGHDRATSLSLFTFMHWRKKWQPTPVFLPGESQGRGSLVGCRLWSCTESDTTEET